MKAIESEVKKVKAIGIRMTVPATILRELGFELGDKAKWKIEEREGEKVAIMEKKKEKIRWEK